MPCSITSITRPWSYVENHLRLLSAQFLARALQENHASHQHVTQDCGRRPMKEALRSKVLDDVSPYLDANGKTAPGDLNQANKALHTDAVARAIDQLGSSRVLNTKPLPINKSESSLPRLVRTAITTSFRFLRVSKVVPISYWTGRQ